MKLERNMKPKITWKHKAAIISLIVVAIVGCICYVAAQNHQSEVGINIINQTEIPIYESSPTNVDDIKQVEQKETENPVYPSEPVDTSRGTKKDGISPSPVEDSTWYTQGP